MRQIIIDKGTFHTRVVVLENNLVVDYRIDRAASSSNVGKLYKGRVTDVIPGMDAAFVDIGLGKNAYLSKMDMVKDGHRGQKQDRLSALIKAGEEILVEVVKDASGTKGAKVSMRLGLTGKYMVLMPDENHVGISKQIDSQSEKERLQTWLKSEEPIGHGLIVRTSARKASEDALNAELIALKQRWAELERYKVLGKAPLCIDAGDAFTESVLMSEMKNKVDEIVCNNQEVHDNIRAFLKLSHPQWLEKLQHYKDAMPIFDHYNVNTPLKKSLSRQVDMSGGAYLIIDETEALTVIDVNSGQSTGKVGMDHTALKVNRKAAEHVARLLKVRELSGIILVDFIDMVDKEMKVELVQLMEKLTMKDRNRVTIHGLTKLGILELTRKKSVDSVLGRVKKTCDVCSGTGLVPSAETDFETLLKDMFYYRQHTDADSILYEISEDMEVFLKNHEEVIQSESEKCGFKFHYRVDKNTGFRRLRADSEEKLKEFEKKTGNLLVNRI